MCPNDTIECGHDIVEGLAYCELCGEPMCPICKCHDVSQVSRVTGYLADVAGWNAGKQQELKDRHRTDVTK
jgi:anaerobic ribonucleoside-triphosphate reductase